MASRFSNGMLASLTLAALALPGVAAATAPSKSSTSAYKIKSDLRYTRFSEKDHYDINVWQAMLYVPYGNFEFQLDVQKDSESGATSIGIKPISYVDRLLPNPNELVSGMTGASIEEERSAMSFQTYYNVPDARYGLQGYLSVEDDTVAPGLGLSGQWKFNKNNTTLEASGSFNNLSIRPTQSGAGSLNTNAGFLGRFKGSYNIQEYYLGLMQDLSKYNYVKLSMQLQHFHGTMNDQYRVIYFYGNPAPYSRRGQFAYQPGPATPFPAMYPAGIGAARDVRPRNRTVFLPLIRFVQYIPQTAGSIHFDYRYGADTWKIQAHMFELSYFQPFGAGWTLNPKVRFYSQSAADFYAGFLNVSNLQAPFPTVRLNGKYYTGDYRLSAYGTMNYELNLTYETQSMLGFSLTGGWFQRREAYSMFSSRGIVAPELKGSGVGSWYLGAELKLKL